MANKKYYKEDIDASQLIKQAIAAVVDQWVNELLRDKIVTPNIGQNKQRGMWDRIKGTLSNLWHGRYNQSNPEYWRNRFGDDLGSQTESYDPSVFSLKEYKELKKIVDETEQEINENMSADVEKLQIVRTIRASAENLKQKLYDIFVSNCSNKPGEEPEAEKQGTDQPPEETPPPANPGRPTHSPASVDSTLRAATEEEDNPNPKPKPEPEEDVPAEGAERKLSEKDYLKYKPKGSMNKGKSISELWRKGQLVDTILHADLMHFYLSVKAHDEAIMKKLKKLKHDAILVGERQRVIEEIQKAIDKLNEVMQKTDI